MRSLSSFLATALLALVAGCASDYKLGTTLPPDLRDVYVPSVQNQSLEPTIHQDATRALLREIRRDGTLNLITDETSATTVLEVTILKFTMSALTYQRNDKHTGRDYRGTVTAHVVFRKRATGTVLFEGDVSGEEDFDASGDLTSAKRRMMPEACKDLAEHIVDSCISLW